MGTPWRAQAESDKGGARSPRRGIPAWSKWPFLIRVQVTSLLAGVIIPLGLLAIFALTATGPDFEGAWSIVAVPGMILMLPGFGLCFLFNLNRDLALPVNGLFYLAAGTLFG